MKKIPPIILAALLQVMPVCRMAYTFCALPSCDFAVIGVWSLGAAALLGGIDAVSGQSVTINSSMTATGAVGHAFSYRITTTETFGDMRYTTTTTPAGIIALNQSLSPVISGTPTAAGVFNLILTVSATEYQTITHPLTITIAPNGPPIITTQPTNRGAATGQNVSFTVVAPGAAAYQWWFGPGALTRATNAILTITNAQAANEGNYYVVAANSQGSITSSVVTLTLGDLPVISTQPPSQIASLGSNITFTVVASAAETLSYQWYFNGAAISGATADSYSLPAVQAVNAGNYSVVVADYFGSTTSSIAALIIPGEILFNNRVPGVAVFPIYAPDPSSATAAHYGNTATGTPSGSETYAGQLLSGTMYTAQLWAAPGANQPESALTVVPNSTTIFGTGTNAGFLVPVTPNPVIPGVVAGQAATAELRVWNNQNGTISNWSQVRVNLTAKRGTSALINLPPYGEGFTVPALTGIMSFNLHSSAGSLVPQKFHASLHGGQIVLAFPSLAGQNYAVQYADPLARGTNSWQTLTNIMAISTNTTCSDPTTNAEGRFYRIGWISN